MVTRATFIANMPGALFSGEDATLVQTVIDDCIAEVNTEAGDNLDRIVELKAAIRLWPAGREGIDIWRAELAAITRRTFAGPWVF